MKLKRRPRKTPPETIIALIDVVFFLLVFFMLIGRMDASAPFEVAPAMAQTGTDMPGGGLTVAIARDGALAVDGVETSAEATLDLVADRLIENPALLVRVNAHHAAELRNLLPLVAKIEAQGARDVVLVVTPEGL